MAGSPASSTTSRVSRRVMTSPSIPLLRGRRGGVALRLVDRRDDAVRLRDAREDEVAVVGARRVEVDLADAQDALEQRLVGVDVLDAVDAGLLDALGEDPAADVQALRTD